MTDHSVLAPGIADLPFKKEAELLARFLGLFNARTSSNLSRGILARNTFMALDNTGTPYQAAVEAAVKAGIITQ